MCGIAGFCLNEKFRQNLEHSQVRKAMANALLEIESRGKDSTGWWATYPNDEYEICKKQLAATQFVSKGLYPMADVPKIVAMHTRAATQGSPDLEWNNHPVTVGDVRIVHNGIIGNDQDYRQEPYGDPKAMPQVDSMAIAAALNQAAEHPVAGIQDVKDALEDLVGSFAFAAQWRSAPDILLLAKGIGSPLVVSEHAQGLAFASTRDAVEKILDKLNLASGFLGAIDEGWFILVKDGRAIRTEEFVPAPFVRTGWGWGYSPASRHESELDKKREEVYLLRYSPVRDDYVASNLDNGIDRNSRYQSTDNGVTYPMSVRDQVFWQSGISGELVTDDDWRKLPDDIKSIGGDANAILIWTPTAETKLNSIDSRFFLLYGQDASGDHEVEVVCNYSGRILDIYHWEDGWRQGVDDRWHEVKPTQSVDYVDEDEHPALTAQIVEDEEEYRLPLQGDSRFIIMEWFQDFALLKKEDAKCTEHDLLVSKHSRLLNCSETLGVAMRYAISVDELRRLANLSSSCKHQWKPFSFQLHEGERYPLSYQCEVTDCMFELKKGITISELKRREAIRAIPS